MEIIICSDHAGADYKKDVAAFIKELGFDCLECGANSLDIPVDYPLVMKEMTDYVLKNDGALGIFMCGTGIGGSIAGNKIKGIRAALCHNEYTARMAREHNNANVLCVGARVLTITEVKEVIKSFLSAKWSNEERHIRRLKEIEDLEKL